MSGARVRPAPSPLRRFAGTLSVLFTGTFVSSAMAFLTQIMLARSLPVEAVGRLAALLAIINLLTPAASVGANYFLLQAFGREGWAARRWLHPCTGLVAIGTLVSGAMLAAYAVHTSPGSSYSVLFVTIAAQPILLGQSLIELAAPRLQLEGRFSALALWQGVTQAGRFLTLVVVFLSTASMDTVLTGYAIVGSVSAAAAIVLLRGLWAEGFRPYGMAARTLPPADGAARRPRTVEAARGCMPFALMTLFYVVYFQGPVVVLEWLRGGAEAGIYNTAFLIIAAFSIIPTVIYMKLLIASICRWAEHDRATFSSAFHVGVPAMTLLGLICMAVTMAASKSLIPLLFGARYAAALPALSILSLSLPIRFAQGAYSSLFISHENMVRKVRYLGLSGVVGVAGCFALVPRYGTQGAATATVVAELVLLVTHVQGASRFIDGISVAATLRPGTVAAAVRHLLRLQPGQA